MPIFSAIAVPQENRTGMTYGIVKRPICRRQMEVNTRLRFSRQRQNISDCGILMLKRENLGAKKIIEAARRPLERKLMRKAPWVAKPFAVDQFGQRVILLY